IGSLTGENVLKAFAEFQPTVFPCIPKVFETFQKQIVKKIESKTITRVMFGAFFPVCVWLRQHTGLNLGKKLFASVQRGFGGKVRIFCAAGAPMDQATAQFYYGTGFNLFINYGLTESNVPVIANDYQNYTTDTCGKPYPHVELKISNPDAQGGGELYLKTPFVMKGYFRDEEATREAFADGWLKTGDLAAFDANKNVRLIGRCKDNIVLSTGKKVCPDEVESEYGNINGIKELVVCGVPASAGAYDEIHAFAVCEQAESAYSIEATRKAIFARSAQLSQYLKVVSVHIVDEIPKTALQKPKRYLLRLLALNSTPKPAAASIPQGESADTVTTVIQLIHQCFETGSTIIGSTRIFEELGMDSLAAMELDVLIEARFGHSVAGFFTPEITVETLAAAIESETAAPEETPYPLPRTTKDFRRFRFVNRLLGWLYPADVSGLEHLPQEGPYLLCANHQSNLDYVWITKSMDEAQFLNLHCLAKKEIFTKGRLSRLLVQTCGLIPLDRGSMDTRAFSR
ncbi:MAG: AMP-binding protein, partial [Oscillospiraceae bacterium]